MKNFVIIRETKADKNTIQTENGGKRMTRFLQILQMLLAVLFIILTLGFISVEMEWTDGTRFRYRGWQRKRK